MRDIIRDIIFSLEVPPFRNSVAPRFPALIRTSNAAIDIATKTTTTTYKRKYNVIIIMLRQLNIWLIRNLILAETVVNSAEINKCGNNSLGVPI